MRWWRNTNSCPSCSLTLTWVSISVKLNTVKGGRKEERRRKRRSLNLEYHNRQSTPTYHILAYDLTTHNGLDEENILVNVHASHTDNRDKTQESVGSPFPFFHVFPRMYTAHACTNGEKCTQFIKGHVELPNIFKSKRSSNDNASCLWSKEGREGGEGETSERDVRRREVKS